MLGQLGLELPEFLELNKAICVGRSRSTGQGTLGVVDVALVGDRPHAHILVKSDELRGLLVCSKMKMQGFPW